MVQFLPFQHAIVMTIIRRTCEFYSSSLFKVKSEAKSTSSYNTKTRIFHKKKVSDFMKIVPCIVPSLSATNAGAIKALLLFISVNTLMRHIGPITL